MDKEAANEKIFKENSAEHRCCCRCMHVRTSAVVIGILELIYLTFLFINTVVMFSKSSEDHAASFGITLAGIVLGVGAIVLMFAGLFTIRPYFLIPHMALQIVATLLLLALSTLCIAALLTGSSIVLRIINVDDTYQASTALESFGASSARIDYSQHHMVSFALSIILVVAMLIFMLGAAVEFWLLLVVYWSFNFLKLKSRHEKSPECVYPVTNGAESYAMHPVRTESRL